MDVRRRVIEYAKDHWRGSHHIAWSLFINGLLPYAVILMVAIVASMFLPELFLSGVVHDLGLWLFALMWISWLLCSLWGQRGRPFARSENHSPVSPPRSCPLLRCCCWQPGWSC
jgi:hypothetical protein